MAGGPWKRSRRMRRQTNCPIETNTRLFHFFASQMNCLLENQYLVRLFFAFQYSHVNCQIENEYISGFLFSFWHCRMNYVLHENEYISIFVIIFRFPGWVAQLKTYTEVTRCWTKCLIDNGYTSWFLYSLVPNHTNVKHTSFNGFLGLAHHAAKVKVLSLVPNHALA